LGGRRRHANKGGDCGSLALALALGRWLDPRREDYLGLGLGLELGSLKIRNEGGKGRAVYIHDLRLGRLDHPGNPEHSNMKNYNHHNGCKSKVYNIRDLHELFY
jgi:hypothetical protein